MARETGKAPGDEPRPGTVRVGPIRLAVDSMSGCGGCDVAILDLHQPLLDLLAQVEVGFWPMAMDFKYSDLEQTPDGHLHLALLSGSVRNSADEHKARLLRRKARMLVALGACAISGGVPALGNLHSPESILEHLFCGLPTNDNPTGVIPGQYAEDLPDGVSAPPPLVLAVKPLDQVVEVDYYLPGCPPDSLQIRGVLQSVLDGDLPPRGAVVGVGDKSVCEECPATREGKQCGQWHRVHQRQPLADRCLLEQGFVCLGPATRSGCGARCLHAAMPCRGCYGPAPEVDDQGARMVATLASLVDLEDQEEAARRAEEIVDPVGTFYRHGLARSPLGRRGTGGGQ